MTEMTKLWTDPAFLVQVAKMKGGGPPGASPNGIAATPGAANSAVSATATTTASGAAAPASKADPWADTAGTGPAPALPRANLVKQAGATPKSAQARPDDPLPMDVGEPRSVNGSIPLIDSVGRKGKNWGEDVRAVQTALNRVSDAGLPINGKADDKTIGAIIAFQKKIGIANPDGLVEVGGLTAQKLAGGKVSTTKEGETSDPRKTVQDHQDHYRAQVRQVAKDVSAQARINAMRFASRVTAGCDDFVIFAKAKINKLKEQEEARAQMADLLAKGFSMAVGSVAMARIEGEVAKYVADKIIDILRDNIVDQAKALATSSKKFEELVDRFVQNTKDRANAIEDLVGKAVDEHANRIIKAMDAGEPLSKEDDAFIDPFVFADVKGADSLLEQKLGIPGAASAKKVQLSIVRHLVEAFMKQYLIATSTGTDDIERASDPYRTPGTDAAVYAAEYTKARERHLDEIDSRVQSELYKKDKK
jgi:hypothetical protein